MQPRWWKGLAHWRDVLCATFPPRSSAGARTFSSSVPAVAKDPRPAALAHGARRTSFRMCNAISLLPINVFLLLVYLFIFLVICSFNSGISSEFRNSLGMDILGSNKSFHRWDEPHTFTPIYSAFPFSWEQSQSKNFPFWLSSVGLLFSLLWVIISISNLRVL